MTEQKMRVLTTLRELYNNNVTADISLLQECHSDKWIEGYKDGNTVWTTYIDNLINNNISMSNLDIIYDLIQAIPDYPLYGSEEEQEYQNGFWYSIGCVKNYLQYRYK